MTLWNDINEKTKELGKTYLRYSNSSMVIVTRMVQDSTNRINEKNP